MVYDVELHIVCHCLVAVKLTVVMYTLFILTNEILLVTHIHAS